ncbi:hypothetical protein STFE110948_02885 [Streptobacillus felis]|uniref:hypothetical protein n=1 Tax=Streptobacillus felis TaxID=1384509 RepID=UPI00083568A0|nr:hypothetical protein [Streptobacillus felis]
MGVIARIELEQNTINNIKLLSNKVNVSINNIIILSLCMNLTSNINGLEIKDKVLKVYTFYNIEIDKNVNTVLEKKAKRLNTTKAILVDYLVNDYVKRILKNLSV